MYPGPIRNQAFDILLKKRTPDGCSGGFVVTERSRPMPSRMSVEEKRRFYNLLLKVFGASLTAIRYTAR
jgi:hypothetical protein